MTDWFLGIGLKSCICEFINQQIKGVSNIKSWRGKGSQKTLMLACAWGLNLHTKRGRKDERCGVRGLQSTRLLYSVIIFIKPKGLNLFVWTGG
jgi:hypothetical protein